MTTQQLTYRLPAKPNGLKGFLARIAQFAGIRRQRRALGNLDESMLKDIGITPAEALAESKRPAWDAPAHWRG